jgi:hypothetical protein
MGLFVPINKGSVSFVLLIFVGEKTGDATAAPLSLQTVFELHLRVEFKNQSNT